MDSFIGMQRSLLSQTFSPRQSRTLPPNDKQFGRNQSPAHTAASWPRKSRSDDDARARHALLYAESANDDEYDPHATTASHVASSVSAADATNADAGISSATTSRGGSGSGSISINFPGSSRCSNAHCGWIRSSNADAATARAESTNDTQL